VVEAAPGIGIGTLTLYAFSSDNWSRPPAEVASLMRLFRTYLRTEAERCVETGVRVRVIGRRDRLSFRLRRAIEGVEARTSDGKRLTLRLAVDYSSRDAILRAAERGAGGGRLTRSAFSRLLGDAIHSGGATPDVDLLVRTGGELRLSDFLLWECAYAELVFTPCLWPDFDPSALEAAVVEYHSRERRFGSLGPRESAKPQPHPSARNA
jgi:undecaprenyl diphosphate synthase